MNICLTETVLSPSASSYVSQTHVEEAEIISKWATQSPFSAPSNPLSTSGPGPTQIPKHSKEYKFARVSAFIIWLSCFDLSMLVLPRLEKISPFSWWLNVKVHSGFQTNAPNVPMHMHNWTKTWVLENLTLPLIVWFFFFLGKHGEK